LKSWRRIQPEDWERHQKYDQYYQAVEDMLERTHTEWGPWDIIAANNRRWARVTVLETLAHRLEVPLERGGFFSSESEFDLKTSPVDGGDADVARYEVRSQSAPSLT
jgi:hypothetical protein